MTRSNDFVLAVSTQLERLFGKEMMVLILDRLQMELDVDDVWEVAVQRPGVFEQARRVLRKIEQVISTVPGRQEILTRNKAVGTYQHFC